MANHSPHPNSLSPHSKQPTSAFQWPIPPSPSHLKPMNSAMNEITVKEILDRYNDDPELMKYILTAKSEEDKKKAARDTLKAEEARIQLRQMDLDLAREQTKASLRHNINERVSLHAYPHQQQQQQVQQQPHQQPQPQQPPQQQPQQQQQSHPTPGGPATALHHPHHHHHLPHHAYPYYSLAPVQQQVLARFNYPAPYIQGHHAQPPPSPSVPYPHSAHPLCPPSSTEEKQVHRLYRQASVSPVTEEPITKKRNRSSISSPNDEAAAPQEKISHNKVMEALKAKIQRSNNGGPPSPLAASPIRPPTNQLDNANKKRKSALPRPVETTITKSAFTASSASSPSPRSAKPVLPPIDTNLGRIDTPTKATTVVSQTTSSSSSSTSSDSSSSHHPSKHNSSAGSGQQQQEKSPSDHILLNTRRARSLSPPSSTTSSSSNSLKNSSK